MKKKPPPSNKKNKIECPICKRVSLDTEDGLILHIVNYHKLSNSLERDHSVTKSVKPNSMITKCIRCNQTFQDKDEFYIHLFKNHLYDVVTTIEGSRLKSNSENIKKLFESFKKEKPQSPPIQIERTNMPDLDFILSIEYWEQGIISNQVDSEVQTDFSISNQSTFNDSKQPEHQNDSKDHIFNETKNETNSYSSNAAKRIYGIDNQNSNINFFEDKSSNIDSNIKLVDDNDDNDDDDDDDYLSFIASTIDTNNVRLQNGKVAPSIEEKKKSKSKTSSIDQKKEEERKFFDKLQQITDMLLLQKIIVNNQNQHKCLKCKMDFDNEFLLMKHIWDYHNEDEFFLY